MRIRSWAPVLLVPAAGVGIVLGMTAAAGSVPSSGGGATPLPVAAAPARPAPLAPTSPGKDPEDTAARPAPEHLGKAGSRLTDASGTTVYTFSGDRPGVSTCTGACAKTWLPVRSPGGKPQAGTGLAQSALGSIQRPDGSQQVALDGLPLYHYAGDTSPGAATGQGRTAFGGTWTAVAPPTAPTKKPAPASPTK